MDGWLQEFVGTASTAALVMAAMSAFAAGFLRGFVGFGGALVIIMVLGTVLSPQVAVAAASISGIASMLQLMPEAVRQSEKPFVVPFGLASFIAAPFGTLLLVAIAPEFMRMVISAFILLMVTMLYRNWRPASLPGTAANFGAGIAAGLVQGSTGVAGPLAVAITLARPGSARQQRANVLGALVSLTLCSLAPLWYHGLFTQQAIVIGLLLTPIYSFATWVGTKFFTLGGHKYFRNGALLALAVIGVVTLSLAVRDYMAG